MIAHLIVLTTKRDETGVEFLDRYLAPYHLNRRRMVSWCRVLLD